MGFDWTSIESSFPTFREDESPRESARKLHDYLYRFVNQLKFTLQNLDTGNWNEKALQTFAKDTTRDVEKQTEAQAVTLGNVKAATEAQAVTLGNVKAATEAQKEQIVGTQEKVTYLEALAGGTVRDLDAVIEVLAMVTEDLSKTMEDVTALLLLQEEVSALRESVDRLTEVVQSGAESVAIGDPEKPLYLQGEIYMNGVAYAEGG